MRVHAHDTVRAQSRNVPAPHTHIPASAAQTSRELRLSVSRTQWYTPQLTLTVTVGTGTELVPVVVCFGVCSGLEF